jgi:hypothetical protein
MIESSAANEKAKVRYKTKTGQEMPEPTNNMPEKKK